MDSFTVSYSIKHPDVSNGDCSECFDFDTEEAAVAFFLQTPTEYYFGTFIEIDFDDEQLARFGIERVRQDPYQEPECKEYAMQAGMMGGCEAYNDAMGY